MTNFIYLFKVVIDGKTQIIARELSSYGWADAVQQITERMVFYQSNFKADEIYLLQITMYN